MTILATSKGKSQSAKHKIEIKDEKKSNALENENLEDVINAEIDNESAEETAEAVNELDPVESLQNELTAERDKYLRLAAEYDNYRKRSSKEREMIYADARINAISKLLPVYDNLERALSMECSDEAYFKGVEMIMTQLNAFMEDMGVREIPAVGEPFDPNRHNAVSKIENTELGENIIAEEYQKGFVLGDRVIRFSTVVVAN